MTQINRWTNPSLSSGASSYPAGFSHTNLKIRRVVFGASSFFLSVAGGDYVTYLKVSHTYELFLPREAKGESRKQTQFKWVPTLWHNNLKKGFLFHAKFAFTVKLEDLEDFLEDFPPPVFCCCHSLTLHPTLSRGQRKVFEGESEN